MQPRVQHVNACSSISIMRTVHAEQGPGPFDLNLLRLLSALLDTASITRAGRAVGLSQPAASRAVARLRAHFQDPLVVRTRGGYVLTPAATALRAEVRNALGAVAAVVGGVRAFEPERSTRQFRVASTDYGMHTVVLPLLRRMGKGSPGVRVQVEPWAEGTFDALERGALDCALYADIDIGADFHYRPLFADGYALVCSPRHPFARTRERDAAALLERAAHHRLFVPRYPVEGGIATDDVWARIGLPSPRFVVEAPYFQAALPAVQDSGFIAVVPSRVAQHWRRRSSLTVFPVEHPALRFGYRLIWHERVHRDPGVAWLRTALGASIEGPGP